MPKPTPEQIEAQKKAQALREAQQKLNQARADYIEALWESEPADLKDLDDYIPFAEQITHSDATQATIAGVLARVLRLEVKAGYRDEVPRLSTP